MRICRTCKIEKPLDKFMKEKRNNFGRSYKCKSCNAVQSAQWRKANPDKVNIGLKEWQKNNPEKMNAYRAKWDKTNPDKANAKTARRRASRISATPAWLNSEQHKEMQDFYWLAKDLQSVTGEPYHVDHIVPLQGENVCGLHVPWNLQVLPQDINLSKGNSFG